MPSTELAGNKSKATRTRVGGMNGKKTQQKGGHPKEHRAGAKALSWGLASGPGAASSKQQSSHEMGSMAAAPSHPART